ncbi:MAG: glycosyltransferase [Anaerolineaceae bacterium]|jgi:glycosyltransferase involved in cell wall biosynthesis
MTGPVLVTHIITDVTTGGAEIMLLKLLSHIDRERFASRVISLTNGGPIGERLEGLGIPVQALGMNNPLFVGMRPGFPDPGAVLRLAGWLRGNPPDLVQTWMYHADLVGGIAARLAGRAPVIWGIRNSNLDVLHSRRSTRWTMKVCALLSKKIPARIVSCSETARRIHVNLGYAADRMLVIPNGFDLDLFRPDPQGRASLRQELGLSPEARLVGLVARFDPQKDHQTFIQAAAEVSARYTGVEFLLCGDGITWANAKLAGWIEERGLRDCFHLLGRREDIPRLSAALDVACSSSAYGEAFPNVLGEAMACGVPCVATDVGDSAYIIGNTGKVVPPNDPQALAGAVVELLELPANRRHELGEDARRRMQQNFDIRAVVNRYEQLYNSLLDH